jgi:hypothetical protein
MVIPVINQELRELFNVSLGQGRVDADPENMTNTVHPLFSVWSVQLFPKHTESVERSRNAVLGKAEQSQDVSFFIELTIY